tara:strand:- start:368 stop:598 length:231 start_codon:yes stop_codon:yes gene_type:complete
MNFHKKKSTKRFNFVVDRNESSHKAGANTVTIESKSYDISQKGYSVGTTIPTSVTMTVKEALALQGFLNSTLGSQS